MNNQLRNEIRDVDLNQLEEQFRGAEYRELIQQHLRKTGARLELAISASIEAMTEEEQAMAEGLVDVFKTAGNQQEFWLRDCSEVFRGICDSYFDLMKKRDLKGEDKIAFNLFQIVTMNLALKARDQKALRKFIGIRKSWICR